MRDLTQHLTTRADDNHAPPVTEVSEEKGLSLSRASGCQALVGSSRCFELNHILHRLCGPPSIPLSFNLAIVLPRWDTYCVNCGTEGVRPPTPSIHRLQRGLPGYLILFAPHAFAPQRQLLSSRSPSPLVFLLISTHFTATLGIPSASPVLKKNSFKCRLWVEPTVFTSDLLSRLHALYTQ